MHKNDFSSYKELYIQVALENTQILKNNFPILAQNVHDQTAIEKMHRAVHNLKTESLLMKYSQLATLCRLLEDMFLKIKLKPPNRGLNQLHISESLLNLINDAINHIEKSLTNIRIDDKEIDISLFIHEAQKYI